MVPLDVWILLTIAWLKRWQDDFDESDMQSTSVSSSTTPTIPGAADKGKQPEKSS